MFSFGNFLFSHIFCFPFDCNGLLFEESICGAKRKTSKILLAVLFFLKK